VLHSGDVVHDRYRVEATLGQGGMGIVYRAADLQAGGAVAIKVLTLPPGDSLLRFRREFRVMSRLDHPGIVRVIESGSHGDAAYLVMAYLSGGTLLENYAGGAADAADLAARLTLLADVADALAYVHAQGIVHRDLKPENVLLHDGAPVLMDFGLAKSERQATVALTQAGAVVGTVAYMSPEQARGHALDSRSDLYALGCLLHWLIAGAPPFEGESFVEVLVKHLREPAPPPSQRVPFVPESLDALTLGLLQKVPADRPSSAGEVAAALRDAAATLTGVAPHGDAPDDSTPGALLRAPLIGRDAIWSALVTGVEGLPPRAALLESATGLGSSRLLDELAQEARAKRRLVVRVRHVPGGRNLPYDGWRRALSRLRENDAALFARAAAGNETPLSWLLPDLALDPGAGVAAALPADVAQLRLYDAVDTLLARIAAEHPHGVLVLVDDLHHADEGSVALTAYVARGAGSVSLALVAGFYPHDATPVARSALRAFDGERLPLAPLEPTAARELIAALLGGQVEDRLADHVAVRAAGNPYFIHELLAGLLQAGQIRRSAGQWSWERSDAGLPPSVAEVFGARIDALEARARTTASAAAAIGEGFDFDLLQTLTGGDEDDLLDDLDELLRANLLVDVGPDRYRFAHPLLRETLHGRIVDRRRRRYHRTLAELLAARPGTPPGVLAEHHAETDTPHEAAPFALAAAQEAEGVYANDVAERYYRLALSVLPDDASDRGAITLALGRLLGRIGRWDEATTLLQRASVGATRVEALRALGQLAHRRGDLDASEGYLREALAAGATEAETHRLLGVVLLGRGDHAGAEAALAEALACASAHAATAPGDLARVQIDLGRLAYGQGRSDEAMRAYRAAEASAAAAGDALLDARVRQVIGVMHYSSGRLGEAIADFERAHQAFRDAGDVTGALSSEYYLGMAYEESGAAERAAEIFARVRALAYRYGDAVNGSMVAATWGWLLMRLGHYEEALAQLRDACDYFTQAGFVPIAQRARLNAAVVLARLERFDEARVEVDAVADQLGSEGAPYETALLALTAGEVHLRSGEVAAAPPLFDRARGVFLELGNPQEATEAALLAAEARLGLGDEAGFAASLAAAEATAAELADPSWRRQIAFLRALGYGDDAAAEAIEVAADESGLLACLTVARRTLLRARRAALGRRDEP
jgi:eukaryotic-like serine/threonine-protein kinase